MANYSKFSAEERTTVYNLLTDSRHEFGLTANEVAWEVGFSRASYYKVTNLKLDKEDLLIRCALACHLSYDNFILFCMSSHVFMFDSSPRCKIILDYLKTTSRENYSIPELNLRLVKARFAMI